jgi:hypothetical protein
MKEKCSRCGLRYIDSERSIAMCSECLDNERDRMRCVRARGFKTLPRKFR